MTKKQINIHYVKSSENSITILNSIQKAKDFLISKYRPLSDKEVGLLEAQGNICDDWTKINVKSDFNSQTIWHCHFSGSVSLASFSGDIQGPSGIQMKAGAYHCTIKDSELGNSYYSHISFMANTFIGDECWIVNVGSIICNKKIP